MMGFLPRFLQARPAWIRWAGRGLWAVVDQGLFSGANFLVNILLARWLAPEEYGAFAVAMSVFYLLAAFHTAVLTEPMMVFGAGKYRGQFRKYLGMLMYGHWGISAVIALLLGGAALIMSHLGSRPMAQALAGLATGAPFLLLLWLARRAPYVEMRPQWAAMGSGINLVVTLGGVFLLWREGLLTSFSGLVLLGGAGAIASFMLLVRIRPQVSGFAGNPTAATVLSDHSGYGRWLVLQAAMYWFFSDAIVPVIVTFQDLHTAGVFRAYQNFTLPIFQLLTALSLLVLPTAAQRFHDAKFSEFRHIAFAYTAVCILTTALYGGVVYILRKPIVSFVLGEKYLPYVELLAVWLWAPVVIAFGRGSEIALRASAKPQFIVYSYVLGSIAALVFFVLLIPSFGLWGAVWSRILSFAVQTGSLVLLSGFGLRTDEAG